MTLEINEIRKTWSETDVCFTDTVAGGEMLVVAGKSGSGKSTVLRMIAGLLPADGGSIVLDGADLRGVPCAKRGIGMVFQSHALFPHLSVLDNVAYGLVCRGVKKKRAREEAALFLESFGFARESDFYSRFAENISGGEAQRVSLARTLIVKPKVVLFDEPLSSLDALLRRKLALEIRSLQKQIGFAGVYVTHDIAEARLVGDRVTVMQKGKQVWGGKSADFDESRLEG